MQITIKKYAIIGIACATSVIILACGGNGASNNEQGVAVTLIGVYGSVTFSGECSDTIVVTAAVTSIVLGDSDKSTGATIGVQNNLSGQFFRADRIFLDYFIPGAALQPPSTNLPVTLLAGPAEASNQGGGAANGPDRGLRDPNFTSLPPTFTRHCNVAFTSAIIVPPVVTEWLNVNSASLPAAPYILEVTARITGISSSGTVYETNTEYIPIDVLPRGSAQASASEADAPFVDDSEISDPDKFNDDWIGDGDVAPEPEVEQEEDFETEIVVEE